MANTYEVPVWFRITANTQDEAWWKIRQLMESLTSHEQSPEYVVEEPVPLLTGEAGWNYTPPEEC